MNAEVKCSQCHERDVFSKGLCSGCYGKKWRLDRKAEREGVEPKRLTAGEPIDAEIVTGDTHLTALNPVEMQEARGDLKAWLEQKLLVIEADIKEANQGLTEARNNGWNTSHLTRARNRAVDDETFYNKILVAVEAGYTIIPEFPVSIFAVRRGGPDKRDSMSFQGVVNTSTYLSRPVSTDSAPAGAGEYRNPEPEVINNVRENTRAVEGGSESRWFTNILRTGRPAGAINFPPAVARSPIMKATATAMEEKTFDHFGVCFPIMAMGMQRQVQTDAARAGDPLVIGQIVGKRVGSKQKVASFIIAWHLNLNEL